MRVPCKASRGWGKGKASDAQVVLNNLYKFTALQMRFPVNAVALVDGTPLTLSLKEFLQKFLEFRCEVVRRRARSEPLSPPLVITPCLCLSRSMLLVLQHARVAEDLLCACHTVMTFTMKTKYRSGAWRNSHCTPAHVRCSHPEPLLTYTPQLCSLNYRQVNTRGSMLSRNCFQPESQDDLSAVFVQVQSEEGAEATAHCGGSAEGDARSGQGCGCDQGG